MFFTKKLNIILSVLMLTMSAIFPVIFDDELINKLDLLDVNNDQFEDMLKKIREKITKEVSSEELQELDKTFCELAKQFMLEEKILVFTKAFEKHDYKALASLMDTLFKDLDDNLKNEITQNEIIKKIRQILIFLTYYQKKFNYQLTENTSQGITIREVMMPSLKQLAYVLTVMYGGLLLTLMLGYGACSVSEQGYACYRIIELLFKNLRKISIDYSIQGYRAISLGFFLLFPFRNKPFFATPEGLIKRFFITEIKNFKQKLLSLNFLCNPEC